MLSAVHTPAAPLSAFVANLWSLSDAPAHAKERIVPSGTLELVINLHEDELRSYDSLESSRFRRFSGAIVSGAYDRFFVIDTARDRCLTGGDRSQAVGTEFCLLSTISRVRSVGWSKPGFAF